MKGKIVNYREAPSRHGPCGAVRMLRPDGGISVFAAFDGIANGIRCALVSRHVIACEYEETCNRLTRIQFSLDMPSDEEAVDFLLIASQIPSPDMLEEIDERIRSDLETRFRISFDGEEFRKKLRKIDERWKNFHPWKEDSEK